MDNVINNRIMSFAEDSLDLNINYFKKNPSADNWNKMLVAMLRYQQVKNMQIDGNTIQAMYDKYIQEQALNGKTYEQVLNETNQGK